MNNIKSLLQLPDTGSKILEVLSKESGSGFPANGIIAGQSVISALHQIANNSNKVVYNDVDVFEFKKQERLKHRVSGINQASVYREVDNGSDEYSHVSTGVLRFFSSRREGPLNRITVRAFSYEDYTFDEKHLRSYLLKTFDINNVQVGVDLKSEKLFWEQGFIEYLNTQQLHLAVVLGPIQSLLRIISKKDQNQGFLDMNYALHMTMAALLGNFDPYLQETDSVSDEAILEIQGLPKIEAQLKIEENFSLQERIAAVKNNWSDFLQRKSYQQFRGPVFGKKYFNLFEKHQKNLDPYFELVELTHERGSIYYPLIKKMPQEFIGKMQPYQELLSPAWNQMSAHQSKQKRKWITSYEKVLNPSTKQSEKENILKLLKAPVSFLDLILSGKYAISNFQKNMSHILNEGPYSEKNKEKLLSYFQAHKQELRSGVNACASIGEIYEELNKSLKAVVKVWGEDNINKAFSAHHKYYHVVKEMSEIITYEEQPLKERLKQTPPYRTITLQYTPVNNEYMFAAQPVNRYHSGRRESVVYVAEEQEKAFKDLVHIKHPLFNKDYVSLLKNVHMLNFSINSEKKKEQIQQVWEKDEELFLEKLTQEFGSDHKLKATQLLTEYDLEQEGEDMVHCVGGYSTHVASNLCSIWHLEDGDNFAASTIEIRRDAKTIQTHESAFEYFNYYIVQNRAKQNLPPHENLQKLGKILVEALTNKSIKDSTNPFESKQAIDSFDEVLL